jgi:hypothetical protein
MSRPLYLQPPHCTFGILLIAALVLAGCQSTYYAVWETLGKEKRHLLKDNVVKAQEEQEAAAEQFKDTLSRLKITYGFDGGEMETVYERLKDDYDDCDARADAVRARIDNVEEIAGDLFTEWEREIDLISSPDLKRKSRQSLTDTRRRFKRLQAAMGRAEAGMEPVLTTLRDQVLYLKHNLNARAISTLKQEVGAIEGDIGTLVRDMQRSIDEAKAFLESIK